MVKKSISHSLRNFYYYTQLNVYIYIMSLQFVILNKIFILLLFFSHQSYSLPLSLTFPIYHPSFFSRRVLQGLLRRLTALHACLCVFYVTIIEGKFVYPSYGQQAELSTGNENYTAKDCFASSNKEGQLIIQQEVADSL